MGRPCDRAMHTTHTVGRVIDTIAIPGCQAFLKTWPCQTNIPSGIFTPLPCISGHPPHGLPGKTATLARSSAIATVQWFHQIRLDSVDLQVRCLCMPSRKMHGSATPPAIQCPERLTTGEHFQCSRQQGRSGPIQSFGIKPIAAITLDR